MWTAPAVRYRDEICALEEGLAGHVGRGGDAHELEHGGGDVGQAAVPEGLDVVVHGDEGHYVEGVGGVGGTVLVDCVVGVAVRRLPWPRIRPRS